MSDSDVVFSKPELRDEVIALREKYRDLFTQLRRIPHLEIPLDFDIEKIKAEVGQIQEWVGYKIEIKYLVQNNYNLEQVHQYAKDNIGRTLIEYKPDSCFVQETNSVTREGEPIEFREDGRLKYFVTDLGEKMPHTIDTLYSFSDYIKQTRVMQIGGFYNLPWHSHHLPEDELAPYHLGVLQIPVETDRFCFYGVKPWLELPQEEQYFQSYEVGKAYLFNSFHSHCVMNLSVRPRTTVFAQFHLEYEPILEKLKPLVDAYKGPFIQKSI